MSRLLLLSLLLAAMAAALAQPSEARAQAPDALRVGIEVNAPVEEVWRAWTTEEGIQSFFAPAAALGSRPGGPYEIYFFPERPLGLRGSEGAVLLAVEPPRRLLFSWNAPEAFGALRRQFTVVEVRLAEAGSGGTQVTLTHGGWGDSERWAELRGYFASAWPGVLRRLSQSFESTR